MKFSKFALLNSRPINVIRLALAVLGLFVLMSIPREHYPNVPLYYVHVVIPYPGATAEEIEKDITQEIEKKTKELQNISSVNSLISDGLSFTNIAYDQKLSNDEFKSNFLELQSVVSNIDFPEGAQSPIINNFTYNDFLPIIDIIVYSDAQETNTDNTETLMDSADRIKTNLELLEKVSKIVPVGLLEKKILISLDRDEMRNYRLSHYEISEAIRNRNISIPAGILEADDLVISVNSGVNPDTPDQIGDTLIRTLPENIYLRDIASIGYYYNREKESLKFNGQESTTLQIFKTEKSDSISMRDDVLQKVEELEHSLPDNIKTASFADTTVGIENSISVLSSNALYGFVLLLISVFLFLGWKPALISALEIPFTFMTSFFILNLMNITLNTSTLFALVLVLGMIVDHSIVILENIIRLRHFHEYSRTDAVLEGLRQVAFPVITSTLTTIGTFLPLVFMPGLIGKFLLPVPLTITVALVVSTVSALVIIPIHYMHMPGNERTHELKIFELGRKCFEILLSFIFRFRIPTCVIALAFAFLSIFFLFKIPVSLYDTEDQPFFFVDFTLPIGSSVKDSEETLSRFEEELIPLAENGNISNFITAIGNTNIDAGDGVRFDKPHNAQFQIEVHDFNHIDESIDKVSAILEKVASDDDDESYEYKIRKQRTGPPTSDTVGFRVLGNNTENLKEIEARITDELRKFDELYNIHSNLSINKPELRIEIDEEKAQQYGHTVASLSAMIRTWLSEDASTSVFINNKKRDVIVKQADISEEEKKNLSYMNFPDLSPQGRGTGATIDFDDVASITEYHTLNNIYREDGKRLVKITADADDRTRIKEINDKIANIYNTELQIEYPDTIFEIGGEFDSFTNLLDDILVLLVIGLFIVYVILVSEFKSYSQPLLIMLTILFTTIGVSFYLLITKSSLSITILYSFVALVGVVVNGSIVLVSTANNLYRGGQLSHTQAILQATLQRFKPIILTNITTILGVLPTALGLSAKSPIWQPMASTIAVGLTFSTLTTLVIIPAFYSLLPNTKVKALDAL